jgi:hypothetical protein
MATRIELDAEKLYKFMDVVHSGRRGATGKAFVMFRHVSVV